MEYIGFRCIVFDQKHCHRLGRVFGEKKTTKKKTEKKKRITERIIGINRKNKNKNIIIYCYLAEHLCRGEISS